MDNLLQEESRLLSNLLEQQKGFSPTKLSSGKKTGKLQSSVQLPKAQEKRWGKEFTYQDYKIISSILQGKILNQVNYSKQHHQIMNNWYDRLSKGLNYLTISQQIIVRLFRLSYLIALRDETQDEYIIHYHESHHQLDQQLHAFWRTVLHMRGFDINRYRAYLYDIETPNDNDSIKLVLEEFAYHIAHNHAQTYQDYVIIKRLLNQNNLSQIFWQQYYQRLKNKDYR